MQNLPVQDHLGTPCSHLPTFIADKFLSATSQSKHAEQVRARRVGVADLYYACSDWSTVTNAGLQFCETDVFAMSATFVRECEQPLPECQSIQEFDCSER